MNSVQVCLTSALTISDFIEPQLTLSAASNYTGTQLGVLSLAATLFEHGLHPQLVDVDQMFLDYIQSTDHQINSAGFFRHITQRLETLSCDVFGFSSICSSYPLTLRVAQEVKKYHPHAQIIVGGPQASVVDVPTLEAFPAVDFVVRGEAEMTLPLLLDVLSGAISSIGLKDIQGITFRQGSEIIRNANAPIIEDLDTIPLPAYYLDPHINDRTTVHLEAGRGCPFTCTFCSTNDFFRRNFRLKSTEKMIEQMTHMKNSYGIRSFSLVHDMYTVNRKKVVEFCETLLERNEEFVWTCSARTDCVDDELLALMARAGCRGIFFGIETGSPRLQRVINKKLNLDEAWDRIRCADQHGLNTAVALITAFPDEKREDLRDTVHYYINSRRYDNADPQLSLLAPLAETPIHAQHKDELVFDHIFSDMSHQGWQQDEEDIALIQAYPQIFPNFYAVPTQWLERGYFSAVRDFVMGVTVWFRWLPIALLQDHGDFLAIFDRWMQWRSEHVMEETSAESNGTPYYNHRQFPVDFVKFVRECYLTEMAKSPQVIAALLESEGISELVAVSESQSENGANGHTPEIPDALRLDLFPYQPHGLRVMQLDVDYRELLHRLRHTEDLQHVPEREVTVVFQEESQQDVRVRQLSPLSSELLSLCDGGQSVQDIMRQFSRQRVDVKGVPADKACIFGLQQLFVQGIIGLSSQPF